MIKLTVLYGHPKSPADFEKYYADIHTPIADRIEGLRRFEISKVTGSPDGSAAPFYRMAELYFDDAAHMEAVMATPAAQRTAADLPNFASGGVTMLVAEVQ
jgi:uncharacterized protein (TIGR02118 family)